MVHHTLDTQEVMLILTLLEDFLNMQDIMWNMFKTSPTLDILLVMLTKVMTKSLLKQQKKILTLMLWLINMSQYILTIWTNSILNVQQLVQGQHPLFLKWLIWFKISSKKAWLIQHQREMFTLNLERFQDMANSQEEKLKKVCQVKESLLLMIRRILKTALFGKLHLADTLWNGIHLGEWVILVGILNVLQLAKNSLATHSISTAEVSIISSHITKQKLLKVKLQIMLHLLTILCITT